MLIVLASPNGYGAEGIYHFTGTVTTFDGQTVEGMLFSQAFEKTGKTSPLPAKIRLNIKNAAGVGQWYEVPLTEVEKIVFNTIKNEGKTNCVVVLKNGKAFSQEDHYLRDLIGEKVFVSSNNPVTGKLGCDQIFGSKIKEIRFHEPFGQVRRDETGRTFPADYEFSPYTGKPMHLQTVD